MAAFNDHEPEEFESPFADTEELDIPHFAGDLRALMVDDSEDEIVLDSDDEEISEQKHGKIRGSLWRHAQSVDVRFSAGSNLTDKVTDNEIGNIKYSKGENIVDLNASFDDENKALEFVDHYLSISGVNVNSSLEVKVVKNDGSRSPFSSCAKGSQKLAMKLKTSCMKKTSVSTFNWDVNQNDHEWEKKEGEKCKEKLLESSIHQNDMFEVGLDTQMAAEVMESLIYSTPPFIDNKKQDLEKKYEKSLKVYNRKKKVNEKPLKVYKRKKNKKQDKEKENIKPDNKVQTFSPVASRTRNGSSVKCSKIEKRKLGDLNFETWKWPKKKRTCRNMRENCEFFLMSSVKRKKRSTSIYKSTSRSISMSIKKIPEALNGFQPFVPSISSKEKIKDLSSNGKNTKNSTRLGIDRSTPDFTSKDLRKRRSKVEIRVLFSQNLDDDVIKHQKKILENLGICTVTNCSNATHLVADRFARTKKMLEAIAFGKQIVTPLWLESCQLAGCIIDEKNYILRDYKKEKEIGFSMPVSLFNATTHPLLKDKSVFITPNVEPDREIIENLVKAVHGQVMKDFQEYKNSDDMLILSCEQDYVFCVPLLDKGAVVYSSELLLNGIIIQKLEYSKHQLFKGHVIMKRYTRKQKKNGSVCLDD